MAAEDETSKELFDAVMFFDPKKVHEILNIKGNIPSDVLDVCLLNFICKKSENFEDSVGDHDSYMKQTDIIYMLLDAGANIDKSDNLGNTSLFYAAMKENIDFCDVLLQCGADMWANTEHGVPIYDYVTQVDNKSQDVADIFNKYYPGLWKAVEFEDIYQVRQLVNYWCRTNLQKDGLTLKDIALQTGNEEIINLVLGVYETMDMVYHILARNTKAVKKMLETCKRKIRLNLRKMSDHGAPILYYLIQSRDVQTIELFIQYGCQIYTIMQDNQGNDMPVLFSALKPDMPVNVFEALLLKDKTPLEEILYKILYEGKTVLEVAMENRVSVEVFNLLIYRGGPLLLCDRNQFNETVRDIAVFHGQEMYVNAIDQCVHDWIVNPFNYPGKREKLAVLGWKFEFIQYTENGNITENALQFSSDVNLLQGQIKELSAAIENGNVSKFMELKNVACGSDLVEINLLWHARVAPRHYF